MHARRPIPPAVPRHVTRRVTRRGVLGAGAALGLGGLMTACGDSGSDSSDDGAKSAGA